MQLPLADLSVVVRSPLKEHDRRQAIRSTWGGDLKEMGAGVVFSLADHGKPTRADADLLWTDCYDRHDDLTRRTIEVFRWFSYFADKAGKTHLLMLDDDCYVVANRLAKLPWQEYLYAGHDNGGYASGGPGYILSKQAVDAAIFSMSRDDCVVGAVLGSIHGVYVESLPKGLSNPWRESDWPNKDNGVIFQHYVRTPEEMYKIREALK